MEEPIITFGSESLILEMFPETISNAILEPISESILEPIPEAILEPIPETPLPKKWCSIS